MLALLVELAVEDRHADSHSAAPEALCQFPTHHGGSIAKGAEAIRCISRGPIIEVTKLLCFTAGVAVADFEDFNLLEPRRRANFHDVALMRLH